MCPSQSPTIMIIGETSKCFRQFPNLFIILYTNHDSISVRLVQPVLQHAVSVLQAPAVAPQQLDEQGVTEPASERSRSLVVDRHVAVRLCADFLRALGSSNTSQLRKPA